MIKKRQLCILLFLCNAITATADTCPVADSLNPNALPSGWTLLVGPTVPGKSYVFMQAIHSLNLGFYYQQVICKYVEPVQLSSVFSILSTKTYLQPTNRLPPWEYPSVIKNTVTCNPSDHDPSHCIFQ